MTPQVKLDVEQRDRMIRHTSDDTYGWPWRECHLLEEKGLKGRRGAGEFGGVDGRGCFVGGDFGVGDVVA